jgi:aminoglycoside phosphotransferase (APT) family kinase protein
VADVENIAVNISEQIRREYATEVLSNVPPMRAEDLPHSYESITPEWLTAILCRGSPDAKVTSYSLGPPDDGTSNRRRIYITYNAIGKAADLPPTVFCKSSQKLTHRLLQGNIGLMQGEVSFYNQFRPMLDINAPTPIWVRYSPKTYNSIIMLVDLEAQGAQFCKHDTPITRQRTESQLSLLAELHGRYYGSPAVAQAPIMTFEQLFKTNDDWLGLMVSCDKGFGAAERVIPERLFRRRGDIWQATLKSAAIHGTLPRTFTHNDVHPRNWYISNDGRMGLADWQTFAKGHWGRDLAYTLSSGLVVEERRLWEKDLIRFYLDRFQAAGGPVVHFEDAWKYYRQHLLSALTWWTVTNAPPANAPSYFQPEDATLAFIGRMTTAIDDLDALESFD